MDPISFILSALVTGALESVASEPIKDAYQELKAVIRRKFLNKPNHEMVLTNFEEKPHVWEGPLRDALADENVDQDEEIIREAQKLLLLANPLQASKGKYNIQISGKVDGFVTGDNSQVTMNFGEKSPDKE